MYIMLQEKMSKSFSVKIIKKICSHTKNIFLHFKAYQSQPPFLANSKTRFYKFDIFKNVKNVKIKIWK